MAISGVDMWQLQVVSNDAELQRGPALAWMIGGCTPVVLRV